MSHWKWWHNPAVHVWFKCWDKNIFIMFIKLFCIDLQRLQGDRGVMWHFSKGKLTSLDDWSPVKYFTLFLNNWQTAGGAAVQQCLYVTSHMTEPHDVHCWSKWRWPPVVQSEDLPDVSDMTGSCSLWFESLWPLTFTEEEGSDRQRRWSYYDAQHTICRGREEREEEEKEREKGKTGGGGAWWGGAWDWGGAWNRGEFAFKVKVKRRFTKFNDGTFGPTKFHQIKKTEYPTEQLSPPAVRRSRGRLCACR